MESNFRYVKVSYHPRIESKKLPSFLTTRCRNSELWFVNNKRLEDTILGYTAKYTQRYEVKLYALAIEGNHIQGPALFPRQNRSHFMRDLNSSIARAVPRLVCNYPGGKLWARRYSSEFMPGEEDLEDRFFYTVLQVVQDGLESSIARYPGYNCFHDAVHGLKRKFKTVRWAEYHAAKRHNPKVCVKDYTEIVTLQYERLPGYGDLTQKQYAALMSKKLEERRLRLVKERHAKGLSFLGRDNLLKTRPGALPKKTKTSGRTRHRPRVLSVCAKRRKDCLQWYFDIYFAFKEASYRYRNGELDVVFPEGTYRPYFAYDPP